MTWEEFYRQQTNPNAEPWYGRLSRESAIIMAREQVEEWSYEDDAHGYCHNRSVLMRLLFELTQGDVT